MPVPLELNRLAYHYVDQKFEAPLFSTEEIIVADLQPGIASFLLELVAQIWNAPDAGSTRSARFNLQGEGTDAQACLQAVLHEEEEFFPASRRLAELLHARSPANASPGILAVLRLVHLEGCRPFAALLKLRYQDQELVQLLQSGGPRLDVRRVENVLLDEIQKGALLPHPEREEYDVKVIDSQGREDPAAYFTEKFLGCHSKKSDDLQIKKLAPTLQRYAQEKELELAVEKMPRVLQELKAQPASITAPVLAEAVSVQEIFGQDYDPQDFVEYLEEHNLGDLDIPQGEFGQKRKAFRRVVYRFVDPEYAGLEISGPPEAFERILSAEGGEITFTVRTSSEGFRFNYG